MADSRSDASDLSPEWRSSVEEATEFISFIDEELKLVYVNHAQPGAGDYYGRDLFEFVSPDFHDTLRAVIKKARETDLPQHYDSEAIGPEGDLSLYSNWIFKLPGKSGLLAFIATDVTHRDRVEAQLELSESTLKSIVDSSPDAIVVVNTKREIIFSNRWEHGMEKDKVLGQRAEMTVAEADRSTVINAIEHVVATGEIASYESVLDAPEETPAFAVRATPIMVNGKVDRVMLVATDITVKRNLQRERERLVEQLHQAQKMESIGQLTGGIAHDFNNLLTVIGGNLDLARNDLSRVDDIEGYLADAQKAVQRGSSLIQQLLAFSRKQALKPELLDLNELLSGIETMLAPSLGETVDLCIETADIVWPCFADRGQLENALINLAVNAKDAMPHGGQLSIKALNFTASGSQDDLDAGDYVLIQVEDKGLGINQDNLERVFEPFFTTKDVHDGSGLGLSMVHGFAHQSGGHVRISSNVGEGTRVNLYLPRGQAESLAAEESSMLESVPKGSGELIMVVEDDPQLREVVTQMVELLGYRAVNAASADEALSYLGNDQNIDLLLSDVVLPCGTNGFDLAQQARQLVPELPVVFVTGYAEESLSGNYDTETLGTIMQKPYTIEQLGNILSQHLSQ